MTPSPEAWNRLTLAARRAPGDAREETAPLGFASRVVAQAFAVRPEWTLSGLVERFAWRALGMAGGVAVASMALNFAPARQAFAPDLLSDQDPVAVVLDLS